MKNYILTVLFLLISNFNQAQEYIFPIGIPHKTRSADNPIIYENGFKEYFFKDLKIKGFHDNLKEIRFDKAFSAFYTEKIMFDNFGKWKKTIRIKGISRLGLVWENIDLFKDENKYTIIGFGLESENDIYASLVVVDPNGNDCMVEDYPNRQKIINYFISKFENLGKSDLFYTVYWNTFPR